MVDTDDVAIGVGLGSFHDRCPEPDELFQYVERADELGIDSIWMPDHVISERPELDPTVLMSVIAARTRDIKMGPSVVAVPGRNPVEVANTYANLDYLTGGRGRVIMGVGLGADPRFAGAVGIPPAERPGRLREAVEIIFGSRLKPPALAGGGNRHGRVEPIDGGLPTPPCNRC